jgi:carbon storage regulator
MLIVTRRPGEKVMVGDQVVITVIEVKGSSVRIGIDAPRTVPVYREEIYAAMHDEGAAQEKPRPTGGAPGGGQASDQSSPLSTGS